MYKKQFIFYFLFSLASLNYLTAQQKSGNKYPSLLWSITGNGLQKPSYLFGTMHVSSKLVFHLSDSFYNAIKNVDAVALELNPDVWQDQMVRLDRMKENYTAFVQQAGNDYLSENSFRVRNYTTELKSALQTEPAIVNSLLYRSYKTREDFEEDTFLDLYIFQTGRKLGKKAAGVENYYEAEKIILEAYADMAKEKKRKNSDLDAEFVTDYAEKMQNAYRDGNLDLMDSLDNKADQSVAFREKFLYKRNEIQANAIDSIIKVTSLFAGVGAAHLPGNRGVIELLRKKGYTVKPVTMADRSSLQKNAVDLLRVPVTFTKKYSEDKFFSVDVPGDLYRMRQDYQDLDRVQYADMSNGSYYIVTRVKTHAAFLGQTEQQVLKKIDSVLYENIPGKILSKKAIARNGYDGFDISSKTRRGDLQRYQIFVTGSEIIIFKMSGKDEYAAGTESDHFFSSINLEEKEFRNITFQPAQGGFQIKLPQVPDSYLNNSIPGSRWEYEAVDKATGDVYLLMRKTNYNFNFLEEDSFDLALAEESFRNPDYFEKQLNRKFTSFLGYPCLETKDKLKDGAFVNARFFIKGPHYYVVAQRTSAEHREDNGYTDSFSFLPFSYLPPKLYTDTFLHITVNTYTAPQIDEGMRSLIEQNVDAVANGNNLNGYISYWQKPKNGVFRKDSTGEMIAVKVQEYPKYYYIADSAKFWQTEISSLQNRNDLILRGNVNRLQGRNFSGISFSLGDTGSSRMINYLLAIKNNFMYRVSTITDTLNSENNFSKLFFDSFRPIPVGSRNIYDNRTSIFFNDLFSTDSALHNKAQQSISNVQFRSADVPMMLETINRIPAGDRDYFDSKTKFISELGYIKDSGSDMVVEKLKSIYDHSADTAFFQNEVIKALARLKTKAAFRQLKELLLLDPPIFENSYDYNTIFSNLRDTLKLSAALFPELLQLTTLDDYKEKIFDLLVRLVDSGYVNEKAYANYFSPIYIDAVVALKKQKAKDEKKMQEASRVTDADDAVRVFNYNNDKSDLFNYSILLMPYYDRNKQVKIFFERLMQSKDDDVKLNTAILMLRNNKQVADSMLLKLAADARQRRSLYAGLERIKRLDKFPVQYKNQLSLVSGTLAALNDFNKMDSLVFVSKRMVSLKGKKGFVLLFKYRVKPTDQWRIAISGLQPGNEKEFNSAISFATLTDTRIKENEPEEEQFNARLKKLLFSQHKSSRIFFEDSELYHSVKAVGEYED